MLSKSSCYLLYFHFVLFIELMYHITGMLSFHAILYIPFSQGTIWFRNVLDAIIKHCCHVSLEVWFRIFAKSVDICKICVMQKKLFSEFFYKPGNTYTIKKKQTHTHTIGITKF